MHIASAQNFFPLSPKSGVALSLANADKRSRAACALQLPFGNSMTHLTIKPSRARYLLLLAASLGFVAAGVFILLAGGKAVAGWMAILFFGACSLVFVQQMLDAKPRLIIADEGVFDRTLGIGMIPWWEIQGAFVKSISGNDFICLQLADPGKYLDRLSDVRRAMTTANEALGFTPISLNMSGLAVDTTEIFELVMKKCEEAQAGHVAR